MQYMGNKIWWNKRFKSRKLNVMSYEKYLEESKPVTNNKKHSKSRPKRKSSRRKKEIQ